MQGVYLAVKAESKGKYSYLQFAEDLGFAATNVIHQLITGHRPLTEKTAKRIASGLGLLNDERRYFLGLVKLRSVKTPGARDAELEKLVQIKKDQVPTALEKDTLSYYSKWYHCVIREMTRLPSFQSDPKWICERIYPRIRPEEAKQSLRILQRLQMIRFDDAEGRHLPTTQTVTTGHEAYGMALMGYHSRMIEIAHHALANFEPEERDISVVTMALKRNHIHRLKSMIHQFQMQLLAEDSACEIPEEVFQINIQLFPFTR